MVWCEANGVDYVLGLARNPRLVGEIAAELTMARGEAEQTGKTARRFKDFHYQTLDSWSHKRRVVGKAEQLVGSSGAPGANPRFVVTSLSPETWAAQTLYERLYCARARWKTGSRNASSICSPIVRRPRPCDPISSGCGLPPWPMS